MTAGVIAPDQLAGCRVLITAQRRAAELAAALQRRGASVEHPPVLSVVPLVDDDALLNATLSLLRDPPEVVVITTGIGLRGWVEAADAAGQAGRLTEMLRGARLVVRGPKARGAVQTLGLTADWVAESETHEEIRDLLLSEGVDGTAIAIQHHGAGSDGLDDDLRSAGAVVHPVIVYRWGPPPDVEAVEAAVRRTADQEYDAVVFTSAPAARELLAVAERIEVLPRLRAAFDGPVLAAAVGSTTARPLQDAGITPLVPDRFRLGALVRAVVRELDQRRGLRVQTAAGPLRLLRSTALLDGEVLALPPAALAVLRRLAIARGAVVSRAELLDVLPGQDQSPHAAEVAVARLREGLPDRALVGTVIKRGYRLAVCDE